MWLREGVKVVGGRIPPRKSRLLGVAACRGASMCAEKRRRRNSLGFVCCQSALFHESLCLDCCVCAVPFSKDNSLMDRTPMYDLIEVPKDTYKCVKTANNT